MPSRPVGFDLGTTRVAVASIDERGRSALVRDGQGDQLIPSVVYFEDDEVLHGRAANLAAATQPGRAAEFYKRDLGQAAYSRAVGGELIPAELVEAILIKKLLVELREEGITAPAAVLTMPASFHQGQRRARLDAARIAGLEVVGTLHDPLAAAMTLADSQGYLTPGSTQAGQRVLVFDLGSGKLDVAIIEIKPGRLRTMSIGGSAELGGRDWDLRLADYLADQFAKQFGEDPRYDMASVRRLLESAEEAKESLSARQQTRVQVQRGKDSAAIIVTRQALEDLTADLVDTAARITEQTLARAGMAWRDVSQLILVGGGARIPAVVSRLEKLTGLKPAAGIHADEAVARGAALYAECLLAAKERRSSPIAVAITDLTVHSLGLKWSDGQTGREENVVLIQRGSELPCGTTSQVTTDVDDQSTVTLQLLEGESRVAAECAAIATITLRDLPPGLPKGTDITVGYHFTPEGRLQVKAQIARTGQALAISVRRQHGLSESQLTDWKGVLARGAGLKAVHALLPKHADEREVAAAKEQAAAPTQAEPPALPPRITAPAESTPEHDFSLETDNDLIGSRVRRRRMTPRRVAIMLGGYIVSAILGSAIGYYILMRIDPSYNWWHLQLPGLRDAPAGGSLLPPESQRLAALAVPSPSEPPTA